METRMVNLCILFPEEDAGSQLIIDLIANIKFSTQKVLGKKYTCNISALSHLDSNSYVESNDDYYLLIQGSDSNNSETFQKQLSDICSKLTLNGGPLRIPKLFKLLLKPNSEIVQPKCLKPYLGYGFFEFAFRGNSTKIIDISNRDHKLWAKILDIAYDFKQMVDSSTTAEKEIKSVYIAGKGELPSSAYFDIKRELQHYGYQILPMVELPDDSEERKVLIINYLSNCQFVIQVINQKYGNIKPGEKISDMESENNIIQDFLIENKSKTRLIWYPLDIKINDARQNLFLNRLLKSGIGPNSQIFNVILQEFMDAVARYINAPFKQGKEQDMLENKTYLLAQDDQNKEKLADIIREMNFHFIDEGEIKDTTHAYLNHLENLKNCDNIIISYSHHNWLQSILGDIIKVKGMGRTEPWNLLIVFGNEPISLQEYTKWLPNLKLVDNGNFEDFEKQMKALL